MLRRINMLIGNPDEGAEERNAQQLAIANTRAAVERTVNDAMTTVLIRAQRREQEAQRQTITRLEQRYQTDLQQLRTELRQQRETLQQTQERIAQLHPPAPQRQFDETSSACALAFLGTVLYLGTNSENTTFKIATFLILTLAIYVLANKAKQNIGNVANYTGRFFDRVGDGLRDGLRHGIGTVHVAPNAVHVAPNAVHVAEGAIRAEANTQVQQGAVQATARII